MNSISVSRLTLGPRTTKSVDLAAAEFAMQSEVSAPATIVMWWTQGWNDSLRAKVLTPRKYGETYYVSHSLKNIRRGFKLQNTSNASIVLNVKIMTIG